MSVFKRSGKETYEYDFWYRGHRFCGGTGEANKREAVAFEKRRKEQAKAEVVARLAAEAAIQVPRTWEVAASRYWHEVGQHHKNANTTFASLAWLTLNIGARTSLEAIDSNKVALLVAKRRNEVRRVGKQREPRQESQRRHGQSNHDRAAAQSPETSRGIVGLTRREDPMGRAHAGRAARAGQGSIPR